LSPYPFFSFGVNFTSGKTPLGGTIANAEFDIPEYFGKINMGNVDAYASYAEKRTYVYGDPLGTHKGTAFYGSVSYSEESFGVVIEYKDYRFGETGPQERDDRTRAKRAFVFQNAPIVHKEHTFTLLSRYPHVIDFNDEVGFQADIFYTVMEQLTGSLNFSCASRHYSYDAVDTSAFFSTIYVSQARKNSWLPSFGREYSPFWETYADLQYFFEAGKADYAMVAFNRRSDNVVSELIFRPSHQHRSIKSTRTTSIPVVVQYSVGSDWVLKLSSERQWVYEDANASNTTYYNHLLSLSVAHSPDYSVSLRYEFTSDFGTIDQRRDWTALDASYKFSNNHLITLTVGGDRGGQICANGVCRVVNPFLGFRASILSYL
jgi:hypothetical protein